MDGWIPVIATFHTVLHFNHQVLVLLEQSHPGPIEIGDQCHYKSEGQCQRPGCKTAAGAGQTSLEAHDGHRHQGHPIKGKPDDW